jgi:hypothetical protein
MAKVILGPGRISYPHIFKPQKNERGEDVYGCVILLPPDYDLKPLKAALMASMTEKFGSQDKWPSNARKPQDVIRRASERDPEGKSGYVAAGLGDWWAIPTYSSGGAPGVIDAQKQEVLNPREAYPGRWARLSVNTYGYSNKQKGVSVGLNNVQLLGHAEALGGRQRAEDEFDTWAEETGSKGGQTVQDSDW